MEIERVGDIYHCTQRISIEGVIQYAGANGILNNLKKEMFKKCIDDGVIDIDKRYIFNINQKEMEEWTEFHLTICEVKINGREEMI